MSKNKINTILSNGEWYNDGNGIDFDVILSSRMITRFSSFKSAFQKMNIAEHQYFMSCLVPKYCDFMAENFNEGKFKDHYMNKEFRYYLLLAALTHDLEEIVINDIPSPVKIDGVEEIKLDIRSKFRNYLGIDEKFEQSSSLSMGIKHLDALCALIEIVEYKFDITDNMDNIINFYLSKLENYKIINLFRNLSKKYDSFYVTNSKKDTSEKT